MRSARALASVLFVAVAAAVACGEEATPTAPPPPAVTVVPVALVAVDEALEFVGQTEAYRHVDLRARVEGVLLRREFREGQDVTAGQLLFVIEQAQYVAEVARVSAELARSQAAFERAQRELARARRLYEKKAAAEDRLDDAITAEAEAAANVQAGAAALRQAELDLGYTEIRAPVAGRIGRVNVDVGNLVGPGSGVLASISQLDPIYVNFSVSEREVLDREQEIREREEQGGTVSRLVPELRLSNRSRYDELGELDFIAETVDESTGSIPVRAVFRNPDGLLRPGQYVTVVIRQEEPVDRLVVPQAAMQENQQGHFVLVVDAENEVEARPVTAGSRTGSLWIVESGVSAGERVIVEGVQKVRPGLRVAPVPLEPPSDLPAAPAA